jgi:ABC-type polar amino acid transport system ATPase subunit
VRGIPRREAAAEALDLLRLVGVGDQAMKFPAQLSGGQQQRVAIARALAMRPNLMLFDEPTSALDPLMTKEVLDVMKNLASMGKTMVVVTHEMEFAEQVADTVTFMDAGAIVESSSDPRSFFAEPASSRARAFLSKGLSENA